MKKAQVFLWLGCVIFGAAIYLDEFTDVPKYLVYPLWPPALILFWLGARELRRLPQKTLSGQSRNRRFAFIVALIAITCIGSLYLNRRSNINLPFATELIIALLTFGMVISILYWRMYRRPIETEAARFPKRWVILGTIALVCFVLAEVFGIHDRDAESTRKVNRELGAALNSWQSKPPGIERADELVRRLRAIDTKRAPADVRIAISEYAKALDDALAVYRAGQPTTAATIFDPIIAEKKEALDQALKKHR